MGERPIKVALRLEDGRECCVPMSAAQWHELLEAVVDLTLAGRDVVLDVPVGDAAVPVRLNELEKVWAIGHR